ncbi:MAG: BRCT domain-containing protein, partial [Planctomycetota bacterium]
VALFIVTTTIAVIYYIGVEEQRAIAERSQNELNKMASQKERQKIGTIVGAAQRGKSALGTMVDYFDEMVSVIIGGPMKETSAEEKVGSVNRNVKEVLSLLADEKLGFEDAEPNTVGFVRILGEVKRNLDNVKNSRDSLQESFDDLQKRFDNAMAVSREKETTLLAEKEKYEEQVNDIKRKYDELKKLVEQTSEERVGTLMTQLEDERTNNRNLKEELLRTEAEFKQAANRMQLALDELANIKPVQSSEVAAYKADGKVLFVDNQIKIVHLNIGSEDRVYRGLTFSVYDKGLPIPKDGKGKAEIEVFDVQKKISIARIIKSTSRRPIIEGDTIANLVWDSDKVNVFVVAGEFDIDGDGNIDPQGVEKVKELIANWGGRVDDDVSVNTDYIILGEAPKVPPKPTFEETEIYPMIMERYEEELEKSFSHKKLQSRAMALSVPIFNTERFLYLIGYKALSGAAGAY